MEHTLSYNQYEYFGPPKLILGFGIIEVFGRCLTGGVNKSQAHCLWSVGAFDDDLDACSFDDYGGEFDLSEEQLDACDLAIKQLVQRGFELE